MSQGSDQPTPGQTLSPKQRQRIWTDAHNRFIDAAKEAGLPLCVYLGRRMLKDRLRYARIMGRADAKPDAITARLEAFHEALFAIERHAGFCTCESCEVAPIEIHLL